MPFRTRDFAIFLFLVAFLVSGIAATIHSDIRGVGIAQQATVFEATSGTQEVTYTVSEPEAEIDTRGERLKTLRTKISELVLGSAEPTPEPEPVASVTTTEPEPQEINLCSSYTTVNPNWSAAGVEFEIVEGARLVYRPLVATTTVNELGEVVSGPDREVLLQLPLRTFPQASKNCLPTDVVGIALDGSLLRNNEYAVYQVFGAETRIGYALDGFPIFGIADATLTLDACGGATVQGEYGYYLSPERAGVLGCFSGQPISF